MPHMPYRKADQKTAKQRVFPSLEGAGRPRPSRRRSRGYAFRRAICAAACFCLITALFLCQGVLPASAQAEALRVVSLGDSIARGYGCEPEQAYGSLLADSLRERYAGKGIAVSFENLGVDGQASGELLESVQSGPAGTAAAEADILTVSMGGNDLLQYLSLNLNETLGAAPVSSTPGQDFLRRLQREGWQALGDLAVRLMQKAQDGSFAAGLSQAAAAYRENMLRLLAAIYGQNPDVLLVLTTIPNPAAGTWMAETADGLLREFNKEIRTGFGDGRVLVADCAAAFAEYEGQEALSFTCLDWRRPVAWSADPHPTPAGHRLMAERHLSAVKERADALIAGWLASRTETGAADTGKDLLDGIPGKSPGETPARPAALWLGAGAGLALVGVLLFLWRRIRGGGTHANP